MGINWKNLLVTGRKQLYSRTRLVRLRKRCLAYGALAMGHLRQARSLSIPTLPLPNIFHPLRSVRILTGSPLLSGRVCSRLGVFSHFCALNFHPASQPQDFSACADSATGLYCVFSTWMLQVTPSLSMYSSFSFELKPNNILY